MKPSLSKRIRISFCAIVALTAFIFGCKKEILTSSEKSLTLSDPKIIDAKSWYDKSYPKNGQKPATRVLNSTGETEMDLSQIIKPDWNEAKSYMRFDDDVVEMPLDSNTKLEMKNNSLTNSPNYSKSSILLLKQGEAYSAFVMTIIGDADYINGDASKISKNTYSKRDQDFSGFIYYSTPKGKFVSGWYYRKGVAISRLEKKDHSKSVNSIQNQSVSGLKTNLVSSYQVCTDWYQFGTDENGNFWSYYLDTTCITVIVDNQNNPPTGGGGSGGSGGGGGGGSPGTGNPPSNPNPCVPQVESVGGKSQKINDLKTNTYYDPGQGGFPPPTGNPCPPESTDPGIFGLNNSNAKVPDENFDDLLDYAESIGLIIQDPVAGFAHDLNGNTYPGQFTYIKNALGETVASYFSPDVTSGPFQTNFEYNLSNGDFSSGIVSSYSSPIGTLYFGQPAFTSITYTPPTAGTSVSVGNFEIPSTLAIDKDINYIYAFGGIGAEADDGRLSCSSFYFKKLSATSNSQEAGVKGLTFVIQLPGGATVREFNFRTIYVNLGIKKADGTELKPGAAAEAAAHAANRAGASLTIFYGGITTLQQVNALIPAVVEQQFKNIFEICLRQEVNGYASVGFNALSRKTVVQSAIWNGNATKILNWLTQTGCVNN